MSKTTVDKVKQTAKEIVLLSDSAISLFIEDAFLDVQEQNFPSNIEEKANRYLAAHLAIMSDKNVTSEAVGSLKREYSSKDSSLKGLELTAYGQEFLRLKKEYVRSGISLVVI
ncbi:DUF4054 domain-containing protein [Carnobacterium maltaromaticum]|uniref:DUF4054 domain-containing protein n=1 Tax=Carnobacterium maltaromaticum TaxID=2751 RepID=UPI00165ADF21|nr:DUF4054 domain-containing protein [Carnobacterium maltaromaticum]MBC9789541.1 DUF4054 domain-containing protein [Carnobacterium maltaromaticum]